MHPPLCALFPLVFYPLPSLIFAFAGAARAGEMWPNDNTHPAGRLDGHRLTLSLVAATGSIAAEGPHVRAHELSAFGEEGQPLSAPGPLIRVTAGTEVAATVRNALAYNLTIHGLCEGRTSCGPVVVPAGTSRTLRVATAVPGTYWYWAAHGDAALGDRVFADSALGGAIVVDPPGGSPPDRIFVLGILADAIDPSLTIPFIPTINGVVVAVHRAAPFRRRPARALPRREPVGGTTRNAPARISFPGAVQWRRHDRPADPPGETAARGDRAHRAGPHLRHAVDADASGQLAVSLPHGRAYDARRDPAAEPRSGGHACCRRHGWPRDGDDGHGSCRARNGAAARDRYRDAADCA